jgi:hypothetical protein
LNVRFELAKLEEIYSILRNRTSAAGIKNPKKIVPQQSANFYREVPVNQGKKKKKHK